MQTEKIRILHLEDSETDATHIQRVLKKAELNFSSLIVDTRADYVSALMEYKPDLVLSDHSMPAFNSVDALDLLLLSGLDIPFILVTGAVSEEFAAQIMRLGADDYILKDRPRRLPSAVLTALEKYSLKRARAKSEAHLKNIFHGSMDILCSIDGDGKFVEVSTAAESIWGYKPAELTGKAYIDFVFGPDQQLSKQVAERVMAGVTVTNFENRYINKYGRLVPMVWSARCDKGAEIMYAVGRDATEKKEAEKKSEENLKLLREAEELQSSILNSLPAQVALLNEEGVIVAVNKTWKDFATENNLQRADYGVGENYISVSASAFGPDLQAGSKIAIAIREVIAGKLGGFSLEYPCHTPFEKRWYHVRIAPTRDGANKGAVIIHTNITTRKIAEEKVIRSETNLTAIIENTDAYIYSLDANLRFVNFNSQSAKYLNSLLGLEIKQGDSVTELFEKAGSKENTFWKEKYALALAGKAQSFESDYSKPGMPRYLSFSINPISENGKVIGLSCHGRDITASKTAQIELKELTKRLQLAIKSAALGIWDWDIIKNHLSWDAGMYRIYEINEVQFGSVYDGWLSRIHPDDRERVNEEIQMAIQGEKAYNTEFRIIWNDLAIRYIKATGIVERDADARAVRMIGANWDITQNKETEFKIKELNNVLEQQVEKRTAQLSQANKDLEAYTATVSHDLRAPARAVAQFATIFRENYGGRMEPKEKELFQYIEDNGRRMTAIIDDLLKLAKYGNEKLTIEEVDMTRLVQGIWQDISRSELHRAELELQQLADIEADESMMQQVLINLLSNAIKYSSKREKPLVSVWCQRQEKYISFYFKDNGAGFDMKHYDRLFGAFQRFHNQRDFAGTGVGLTLVKRIIEKHGGTVGAESKVDEGATFYFTLPVARIKISDGL